MYRYDAIDKVADFVDDKTGGKFDQHTDTATDKAKDALDSLDGQDDEPGQVGSALEAGQKMTRQRIDGRLRTERPGRLELDDDQPAADVSARGVRRVIEPHVPERHRGVVRGQPGQVERGHGLRRILGQHPRPRIGIIARGIASAPDVREVARPVARGHVLGVEAAVCQRLRLKLVDVLARRVGAERMPVEVEPRGLVRRKRRRQPVPPPSPTTSRRRPCRSSASGVASWAAPWWRWASWTRTPWPWPCRAS